MASNEIYASTLPHDELYSCVQTLLNGTSQITNTEIMRANRYRSG